MSERKNDDTNQNKSKDDQGIEQELKQHLEQRRILEKRNKNNENQGEQN